MFFDRTIKSRMPQGMRSSIVTDHLPTDPIYVQRYLLLGTNFIPSVTYAQSCINCSCNVFARRHL
jgi:hypothetical protein